MKILFLADIVPYPPDTGIKIRTYNVLKELAANGNEIYLLAFNHRVFISDELTKKKYKTELEKVCAEVHLFEIPSEVNNILKYSLCIKNIFQREPYRVWRYFSDECIAAIHAIIKNQSIDICHMDKLEFYKYVKFLKGIPVCATNHNIESDLMRQRIGKEHGILRRFFAFIQWKKMERYEKYALNKVSGYVTCTEHDALYFKTKYGVNAAHVVVENGVDLKHYRPTTNRKLGGYFLIIGAQNKESTANFDATWFFFNELWPTVSSKIGATVKIVGRNPDRTILNYAANDSRVKVIGYVDDERELFRNALALIVPLRIGGGSRLKILTAFGLGKAVISTTKGAEGIDYKAGKNILIADSPASFSNTMVNVWHDKHVAMEVGENARILALEKYDWKVLGKKLHKFYCNLHDFDVRH